MSASSADRAEVHVGRLHETCFHKDASRGLTRKQDTMNAIPKRASKHDFVEWREPLVFECHDELSDEEFENLRKAAKAPAEDDSEWTVVDGPGW